MMKALVVMVAFVAGCTKHTQYYCTKDGDCTDPMYPFCDVNGEYAASEGQKNICTIVPPDCPISRCGCTPSAVLSCTGDQLVTCGADGVSTATDTCALGCAADGTRCLTFTPSNGLGPAFIDAASQPDITLPLGTTIDTTLGQARDGAGSSIAIKTAIVAQPGGPMIRVFEARSFEIDGASITGQYPVAFVASDSIGIHGYVAARGKGSTAPGPGAQTSVATCFGQNESENTCGSVPNQYACGPGGGGAGGATAGGAGGYQFTPGGAGGSMISGTMPLVGGCSGGSLTYGLMTFAHGGVGGGAIQLVAGSTIALSSSGMIDVGGGGGDPSAGGGSAGQIVLEAPLATLSGASTGIVANGGAGGGCSMNGADGTTTVAPAPAPQCGVPGGNGGSGMTPAQDAFYCTSVCILGQLWGGGGGSVGSLRVATRDATLTSDGGAVISARVVPAQLVPE